MQQDNANTSGRDALIAWQQSQPTNAYTSDRHFRKVLARYAQDRIERMEPDLVRFGEEVARPVDALVRENNLNANLPRLERYNGLGVRTEQIVHHPTYHEAGRFIYGSGVMEAYSEHPNHLGALARFYVSSYNGEAGHNCPLACTAGVIRVLQELGSDEMKQRFLQRLLDRDYDRHYEGAQFLTEVQGGSDVGSNAARAVQAADGSWRLSGEKWFCSNIDADLFLMTARPEIEGKTTEGTRGLGLFLVPRVLDNGRVNEFKVRRLKDKLGTRSMASGEADFEGAVAYHMGALGDGFKNMMELVINTSRIYNAVGCAGIGRRAFVTAQSYAKHRAAFGPAIIEYPLVQEHLADMRVVLEAMTSGTFYVVALQDRIESKNASPNELGFQRLAVNLNKLATAKLGRWMVVQGIEILGGNGTIETFSVLPRLLRDAIVYENWEGTHNTLLMQMYRDMAKYRVHESFVAELNRLTAAEGADARRGEELRARIHELGERLNAVLEMPAEVAPVHLRPVMDELAFVMYAAVSLGETGTDIDNAQDDAQEHYFEMKIRPRRTMDDGYFERIKRLAKG